MFLVASDSAGDSQCIKGKMQELSLSFFIIHTFFPREEVMFNYCLGRVCIIEGLPLKYLHKGSKS